MNDLHTFTVPVCIKMLNALSKILEKAEAHAKEQGIAEETLLSERLAPDMYPLVRQVQISCDQAKGAAARLSGTEIPKHEDTETSFAELRARIAKTVTYLESIPEASFVDATDRQIVLPYFPGKYMTGFDYAREYVIPNFLFHVVTSYALLRKAGLELGKADFVGGLPLHDLEGSSTSTA